MPSDVQQTTPDPGLAALVAMLRYQGVAADMAQIRHRIGSDAVAVPDILRCAKDHGLKASTFTTKWARLAKMPMPALAILKDGSFLWMRDTMPTSDLKKVFRD